MTLKKKKKKKKKKKNFVEEREKKIKNKTYQLGGRPARGRINANFISKEEHFGK
jgi:hypothetical protein